MNTKSCQSCGRSMRQIGTDTRTDYTHFEITIESGGKKYEAGPFCVDCYENVLCGFRLTHSMRPEEWKSGAEGYVAPSFEEDKK